jgi:hypothetical protein
LVLYGVEDWLDCGPYMATKQSTEYATPIHNDVASGCRHALAERFDGGLQLGVGDDLIDPADRHGEGDEAPCVTEFEPLGARGRAQRSDRQKQCPCQQKPLQFFLPVRNRAIVALLCNCGQIVRERQQKI